MTRHRGLRTWRRDGGVTFARRACRVRFERARRGLERRGGGRVHSRASLHPRRAPRRTTSKFRAGKVDKKIANPGVRRKPHQITHARFGGWIAMPSCKKPAFHALGRRVRGCVRGSPGSRPEPRVILRRSCRDSIASFAHAIRPNPPRSPFRPSSPSTPPSVIKIAQTQIFEKRPEYPHLNKTRWAPKTTI